MSLISSFMKKEGRILPVYVLLDVSGSMRGSKIDTVNVALKEMLNEFKKIEHPKGIIEVCLITFGGDGVKVIKPLSKLDDGDYYQLTASGQTPMGECFEKVSDLIEDTNSLPSNAYIPTILLVSDGCPTDAHLSGTDPETIKKWPALQRILSGKRTQAAVKLPLSIGDDANIEILKCFKNNDQIPVIFAKDTEIISKYFKWVTMSVSVRSVSANPNEPVVANTNYFDDGDMEF